jgi:hypothetical protein
MKNIFSVFRFPKLFANVRVLCVCCAYIQTTFSTIAQNTCYKQVLKLIILWQRKLN